MTCPVCGFWCEADRDTGYDADGICPQCDDEGWTELSDGRIVNDATGEGYDDDDLGLY